MATQEFPDLAMPEPIGKTGGFNFLFPTSLLSGVSLVHSPSKGRVALWFSGVSGKSGEKKIRTRFGAALGELKDVTVRGTQAKVMIILKGQAMNRRGDFAQQTEKARAGLELARKLVRWLEVNGHLWQVHLG